MGVPVYAQLNPDVCKEWTPAVVTQRQNDRSYVIDVDGANYRRDRTHLKLRNEPRTPSTSISIPDPSQLPTTDEVPFAPSATPVMTTTKNQWTPKINTPVNQPPTMLEQTTRSVTPMSPASESSIDGSFQRDTPRRPRREVKAPAKFKDYLLDFD